MHGRITVKLMDLEVPLWFNNYSKVELAKILLPGKKGFSGKPEEIALLHAVKKRAEKNHIILMLDLVVSGHLGYVYGTNSSKQISKAVIAEKIAEASQEELYAVWLGYLEAYGFNLDSVSDLAKKKRKAKSKVIAEIRQNL